MNKIKILISERKLINKFFKSSEISSIEPLDYLFSSRKKMIVYTPPEFTDRMARAMHKAGGGNIGEYEMCSFRIEGTGTYKPGIKSIPHKGSKGELSREREIRLEIECSDKILNKVLDAMLKVHPYEEVAYEILDFTKRENASDGAVVTLKKPVNSADLLSKLNKKIVPDKLNSKTKLKKIAILEKDADEINIEKSRLKKAEAVLFVNNKVNLIIL